MYNSSKRIITLVVMLVLVSVGQAMSQTRVLGLFQLGKSTYDEVKAKLPKGVNITSDDGEPGSYGGPELATEGTGYDINGLHSVEFDFDKKRTLAKVRMFLEGRRLNDIKKILSSKYRPVRSKNPEAPLLFKANHDYVYLFLPWDKDIVVDYMTSATYRQEQLDARQTAEDKKALERREQKRLERKLAEEAEKF